MATHRAPNNPLGAWPMSKRGSAVMATMKAIRVRQYGDAGLLRYEDAAGPEGHRGGGGSGLEELHPDRRVRP